MNVAGTDAATRPPPVIDAQQSRPHGHPTMCGRPQWPRLGAAGADDVEDHSCRHQCPKSLTMDTLASDTTRWGRAGSAGSTPRGGTHDDLSPPNSRRTSMASGNPCGPGSQSPGGSKRSRGLLALSRMMDLDDLREEDAEDLAADWGACRRSFFRVLTWRHPSSGTVVFDAAMGVVILVNITLMIRQTDWAAACELDDPEACIPEWANRFDNFLLSLYAVELGMRLFVYRCACFRSPWTMLDMAIVGIGVLGIALASIPELKRINVLRMLRVARFLRFIRILKRFPTLCNMVGGFVGAMHAMAWGILMILLLLVAWSLFAVEFIHPINKRVNAEADVRCANAFQSVLSSTLLFFQTLVAGDSWGACAIPIIEEEPWTYGLFAGALVTVQLGFTNLVLAIIVDKAAEAREGSKEEQRAQRARQQVESFETWRSAMKQLDTDASGSISEQELMAGYSHPRIKETLEEMNITKNDLRTLFHLMDHDGTGQLSYHLFLESFYKAQVQDPKVYLMVMQLRMQTVEKQVAKSHEACMQTMASVVREAMAAMGPGPPAAAAGPPSAPPGLAALFPDSAQRITTTWC